ncbi:MAG: type 1 glutamine amidotransferase [Thermoleophilaceae bacterium]|nr:type 1 glutamine amidotransferase [Thermoleophilaceae bacterium]
MADQKLEGKTIAILATDGVEQVELTEPRRHVEEAGAETHLIAPESGEIQGFDHHDKDQTFKVDKTVSEASADDYDGLILPGGVINPDLLRLEKDAIAFVRAFAEAGKPIGAICHGPWTLIDAGVVEGLTLTSWPSLKTDIENAGGTWVDEEVHVDKGLTTSRKPEDLDAFGAKIVEEFCEGKHDELRESVEEASAEKQNA